MFKEPASTKAQQSIGYVITNKKQRKLFQRRTNVCYVDILKYT